MVERRTDTEVVTEVWGTVAKVAGKVGTGLMYASFIIPTIAELIARTRQKRTEFKNKLEEAKKRCSTLEDPQKKDECKRQAIAQWARSLAQSYAIEERYLRQALAKQPDPEKKEKIKKLLEKTYEQKTYYMKLANLVMRKDIPITDAYEMARKG